MLDCIICKSLEPHNWLLGSLCRRFNRGFSSCYSRCGKDGTEPAKIDPPPAKVNPPAQFDTPKTPVAEVAPVNKSSEPTTTPSTPTTGLLGPKNYSCEPCGKYYDNSHIWHYHNHMDKKHGIPNPMANQGRNSTLLKYHKNYCEL